MATTGVLAELTRSECVHLLGVASAVRVVSVSVGDTDPTRLVCFPQPDGTVVIPTGANRDLVTAACGHPVTVEFETLPRAAAWSTRQLARAGLIGCQRLVPPFSINRTRH